MKFLSRRTFVQTTVVAACVAPARGALAEVTTKHGFNDEQIAWASFEDGIKRATADRKPIFLLVHATWCPRCKEYKELFFNKRVAKSLNETFVPVLIDVDEQEELQAKYAPDGDYVPRSMVLDPDGIHLEEVKRRAKEFEYYLPPDNVYRLQAFLQDGEVRNKLNERKKAKKISTGGGLKLSLD